MKALRTLVRLVCLRISFLRHLIGTPSVLYIIRHAQSARNMQLGTRVHLPEAEMSSQHRHADHQTPVTERGERQIIQTAQHFYERFGSVPDVVIDSGYKRTIRTANGLMEEFRKHKYKIVQEEELGLRERDSGYSFVMSEEQVDQHFPFMRTYWPIVRGFFARPVGGESLLDVIENRLQPVILKVFKRHAGKEVCFVTHGRVYQCLRYILDGMDLEEMEAFLADPNNVSANCGVTVYRYDPVVGKLVLDECNVVLYDM